MCHQRRVCFFSLNSFHQTIVPDVMNARVRIVDIGPRFLIGAMSVWTMLRVKRVSIIRPRKLKMIVSPKSTRNVHFSGFLFFLIEILDRRCLKNYLNVWGNVGFYSCGNYQEKYGNY